MLDTPYHVDVAYDYIIPPEMKDAVTVGSFVMVPFGIRNQLRAGLVAEIKDSSEYKDLKMIRHLCPESIALGDEMMGLAAFLRGRTLCSIGDAVRAMVPTAALTRLSELYSVNPSITSNSDEIRSSDLFVYRYLQEFGETSLTRLREKLGVRAESVARHLANTGILVRRIVFEEAKEGKLERYWSLAVSVDAVEELVNGKTWEGVKLSSVNHKNILATLREEGDRKSVV